MTEDQMKKLKQVFEAMGGNGNRIAIGQIVDKQVNFFGVNPQTTDEKEEKPEAPKNKGGRPKRSDKASNKAFVYNAGTLEETNSRLQYLFLGLKALEWIKADTELKRFMSIFSGRETICRVVWTGGINTLAELFRELVNRKKLVGLPEGESIWVMVNARFWENEGNKEFGNDRLCDTRPPVNMKENIDVLVNILNPEFPIEKVKKAMLSQGK